jgi:hypothetical protein
VIVILLKQTISRQAKFPHARILFLNLTMRGNLLTDSLPDPTTNKKAGTNLTEM